MSYYVKAKENVSASVQIFQPAKIGLSACTKHHNPTPTRANTDPVASTGTQPKASAVIGTRRAPIPPTALPPVLITPVAEEA